MLIFKSIGPRAPGGRHMRRLGWLISVTVIVGAAHAPASLAQSPIGSAASAQNRVQGIVDGASQPITTGGSVFQNEHVRTGGDSHARLVFLDQTDLGVGPESEVTLDRFVYNPDRNTGRVAIDISRGVFRFVTGSQDPKDYAITTPIATIEVRGTEFHLLVERDYIVPALVHGALRMTTVQGRVVSLTEPGTTVTIYANGQVVGPSPWSGPFTNYASNVPFPYFASSQTVKACDAKPPYLPWGGNGSATITVSDGQPCSIGWHDTGATILDSMQVTSSPSHGSLRPQDQHVIIYTPASGYKGQDSFTLSMQEHNGGRRATLSVKVNVTIK